MARMILLYAIITVYFWVASVGNAINGDFIGWLNCTVAGFISIKLFLIEIEK